jgi:hypothetical protein
MMPPRDHPFVLHQQLLREWEYAQEHSLPLSTRFHEVRRDFVDKTGLPWYPDRRLVVIDGGAYLGPEYRWEALDAAED